jgi:flagellin
VAINDITLTAGMRANLVSLQQTVDLLNRTQERLSTGKKVNTALDNPTSYFASQSLLSRASDLSALKDAMGQGIQTVQAADQGIEGIQALIEAAKGLAQTARSASTTSRSDLAAQFDALLSQIDNLASDSGYQGTNLLDSATLTVNFNEDATSSLTVTGFDASSSGLSIANAASSWVSNGNIDNAVSDLNAAVSTLRTQASTLSANLNVITTREDFTTNMINTLTQGSDKLVLADMNEEGANMLMLQTRQSLGITALSLSSQAAQMVLKLFA